MKDDLTRRTFLRRFGAAGLGLAAGVGAQAFCDNKTWAEEKRLNVVYILADDLGWTDLGCYGSQYYETPHIDALARSGMRFTNAYAACHVCSPTRASILTGKYPARLHLTQVVGQPGPSDRKLRPPNWKKALSAEEVTLAEALRRAGYATAIAGKLHVGNGYQGFQEKLGPAHVGKSYFKKGSYITDLLTKEAAGFIQRHRDKPFFLYLSHHAVHVPLEAKKALIEKYQKKPARGGQKNAVYAAMIESLDQSVGRVLKKLKDLSLADKTMVVFMSDNGGWRGATSIAPLRGGKGGNYEGGVRVPMIVKYPGVVKPATTYDRPVTSVDHYPTILEAAGVKGDAKHNGKVDGESLLPVLTGRGELKRDAIFWHYPHYKRGTKTPPLGAIRKGDFKLIEFYEDKRLELYDLKNDIGEGRNLAASKPELAEALQKRLARWRASVGAQMPQPNPSFRADPK